MNVKRLAIVGISGRIGKELLMLAPELGFQVTCGVTTQLKKSGEAVALFASMRELPVEKIDAVIDFSLPAVSQQVAEWCAANRKPLVSGVTGLGENERVALATAAKKAAVLWSPNMSLGVAVLSRTLHELSKLKNFSFQVEEFHHSAKRDQPSGTALKLQAVLAEATGAKLPEPVSIRGGGIFGIHRVFAMGEDETLMFEHQALNRRVFARGALVAATWLINQPPGLYSIDDLLGT